jgi:hypothetical protein
MNDFITTLFIVKGRKREMLVPSFGRVISQWVSSRWSNSWNLMYSFVQLPQPHFEASVRMRLTLPKVGTWSPPGLPWLQSSIAEVKTPQLELFFIPLESSRSGDVENGLSWAIQTYTARVMVKRRAMSQTGSLTPDHKKSRIDPTPGCAEGVRHTVGKLLRKDTSFL